MTLFLFFLSFSPLFAQSTHQHLRNGDGQYDLEHYKAAEKHYRDAADLKYGDPMAQYNLGNALYQQGNWEDAAVRFEQAAAATQDAAYKADALHNLGNARMQQHKFKEAVDAYENSLRLRPGDPDTKQNLQMAKKKLREEQQRQQQEQQKQNQQQNQQEQESQQDSGNPQDNQQQEQNPQPQAQPQAPNEGQPQQEQQPVNQQQKLKKEEARRLLETAIGPEDQKNTRKYREQRRQPKPSGKEKDW